MESVSFLGSHPVVASALGLAEKVAGVDRAVLIVGEAGSGRRTLARLIHLRSANSAERMVFVDCEGCGCHGETEVPALGGAGTIVLSQIDKLSAAWRPWLAKLLEASGALDRNGRRGRVRIIATSGSAEGFGVAAELLDAVQPVPIFLPALRHRRCDIPVLVEHFLTGAGTDESTRPCGISDEALVFLWQYDWPGNVRELEELMVSLAASAGRGLIAAAHLPAQICPQASKYLRRPSIAKTPAQEPALEARLAC
jgi:DNA-binding NtrC family response regulator